MYKRLLFLVYFLCSAAVWAQNVVPDRHIGIIDTVKEWYWEIPFQEVILERGPAEPYDFPGHIKLLEGKEIVTENMVDALFFYEALKLAAFQGEVTVYLKRPSVIHRFDLQAYALSDVEIETNGEKITGQKLANQYMREKERSEGGTHFRRFFDKCRAILGNVSK